MDDETKLQNYFCPISFDPEKVSSQISPDGTISIELNAQVAPPYYQLFHPVIFENPPQAISGNSADSTDATPSLGVGHLDLEPVHSLPAVVPETCTIHAPIIEAVVDRENKEDRIKPYQIAQELIARVPMRLLNEQIYLYNGRVYAALSNGEVKRAITKHCRSYVNTVGVPSVIKQIHEHLQAEPDIAINAEKIAEGEGYLAFENGLLDIKTGQLRWFTSDIFVTASINSSYSPEKAGECPHFNAYLYSACGGDPLLERRIWEMLGYCLVPDMNGKAFFLLQGVSNSGKSLLAQFLETLYPSSDVSALDFEGLGSHFGPSDLIGKRLCLHTDLSAEPWGNAAIGKLKELTGNDLVSSDVKYSARIKFHNTAKFLFATNHVVALSTRDDAFLKRLIVIPFQFSVPPEQQDHFLLEKFRLEREAVVAKAINTYFALRGNCYQFSGQFKLNEVVAQEQGIETISWNQAVAEFFFCECEIENGKESFTEDLFNAFTAHYPKLDDFITFSTKLYSLIEREFPGRVKKKRKRRTGERNPISVLEGVRLIHE